jgi:hypothetical protein
VNPLFLDSLLVAFVGFNDGTSTVSAITDTVDNTWTKAVGPIQMLTLSQTIYYCRDANPGSTSLIVMFSGFVPFADCRILEYSGADTVAPLVATASSSGFSQVATMIPMASREIGDLFIAGTMITDGTVSVNPAYRQRVTTVPDSDVVIDAVAGPTGSFSPSVTLDGGSWVFQGAVFGPKVSSGSSPPSPNPTPIPIPMPPYAF